MKAGHAVLVAIVAAVTLTSVAAAGPEAAKQRVAITTQAAKTTSTSPFTLTPLQAGTIKADSGMVTAPPSSERVVMREGQRVSIYEGVGTYKGKLGSLVIRARSEWVDAGNGYHIATDTWKVVRGTGQYAGVTGAGRGGSVWHERTDHWSSHVEGFLTLP
jgi:hypothetical protein